MASNYSLTGLAAFLSFEKKPKYVIHHKLAHRIPYTVNQLLKLNVFYIFICLPRNKHLFATQQAFALPKWKILAILIFV